MNLEHLWIHKIRIPLLLISAFFWTITGFYALKWIMLWSHGQLTPGVDTSPASLALIFGGSLFMSVAGLAFTVYAIFNNLKSPIYVIALIVSFLSVWMIIGD